MMQPDDPGVPEAGPGRQLGLGWKVAAGVAALIFGGAMIVATTFAGNPDNSLHASAQAWSFVLVGGVLGAIGIGVALPMLPFGRG
ncbi:MAG: hypothetical protein VW338_00910 [Rhodospirillaceae bacterium]